MKGPGDLSGRYLVSGLAQESVRQRVSFLENLQSSRMIGSNQPMPIYIDGAASWAFFKEKNDISEKMTLVLGRPISEQTIPKKEVNWKQLVDDLSTNESQYRVSP